MLQETRLNLSPGLNSGELLFLLSSNLSLRGTTNVSSKLAKRDCWSSVKSFSFLPMNCYA